VNGDFAAGSTHRDANVPGRKGRSVVYTIANDSHFVAFRFNSSDIVHFVLRETFAFGFFAANFFGDAGRDSLTIA